VVWLRQPGAELRIDDAVELPALRARRKERLGLLPVVLRPGIRGRDDPPIPGQTLHGSMLESAMQGTAHAIHALLPVVSPEGQEALETGGEPAQLQGVQVGYSPGILELLRLVPGACAP